MLCKPRRAKCITCIKPVNRVGTPPGKYTYTALTMVNLLGLTNIHDSSVHAALTEVRKYLSRLYAYGKSKYTNKINEFM